MCEDACVCVQSLEIHKGNLEGANCVNTILFAIYGCAIKFINFPCVHVLSN